MITIVSGFQRCGSSLMCQMLAAGGMTVFHDADMGYPAFETFNTSTRAADPSWLEAIDGQAVKWLEPQRAMPAPVTPELRIIWMTRNHRQQSKSAVKFLREVGGMILAPETARAFERSYRTDESRARAAWNQRGRVLVLSFEHVINEPYQSSESVQQFLDVSLDVFKMAAVPRPRPTNCLPGFLELDLIAEIKPVKEARA